MNWWDPEPLPVIAVAFTSGINGGRWIVQKAAGAYYIYLFLNVIMTKSSSHSQYHKWQ